MDTKTPLWFWDEPRYSLLMLHIYSYDIDYWLYRRYFY